MFNLFDFDLNGMMTIDEMVLIFSYTIKSLYILTGIHQQIPPKYNINHAALRIFKLADIDRSDCLSCEEIKKWVNTRKAFIEFLTTFEPQEKIYYDPKIYQNFPEIHIDNFASYPLNTKESLGQLARETFTNRMKKKFKKIESTYSLQKFTLDGRYLMFEKQDQLTPLRGHKRLGSDHIEEKKTIYNNIILSRNQSVPELQLDKTKYSKSCNKYPNMCTISSGFLSAKTSAQNSPGRQRPKLQAIFQKNVITIRGRTYSKNDIIVLKRYFEEMDRENKGYITPEDYARNFKLISNSSKHAKNIFSAIDRKRQGKITLSEFIKVSIPYIDGKEYELAIQWANELNKYNENIYFKKHFNTGDQHVQISLVQSTKEYARKFAIQNIQKTDFTMQNVRKYLQRKSFNRK